MTPSSTIRLGVAIVPSKPGRANNLYSRAGLDISLYGSRNEDDIGIDIGIDDGPLGDDDHIIGEDGAIDDSCNPGRTIKG